MVLLNRAMFNVDPDKVGIEAFNFGSSNLMGFQQLKQVAGQDLSSLLSGTNPDGTARVVKTFDVETTGIFRGAQTRSQSITEMTNGVIKQVDGTTMNFASEQLGGLTVVNRNAATSLTVNQFLTRESGGLPLKDPTTFLDESVKFIDNLLESNVIAGHNIFFDIGSLTSTMKQMEGYDSNTAAKSAVSRLLAAVSEEGRVVDTLEFSRVYLQDQVNELLATASSADEFARLDKFRELIYSPEFLARIRSGGSAPYASMEAISLNTNLIDLLYKDAEGGDTFAQEVFDNIFKGTHVADTDSALQTYMSKYLIEDDPSGSGKMLKVTPRGTRYNNQVVAAQKAIARSSALTVTTNISSVEDISTDIFDFIMRDDKAKQRVSLTLEKGVLDPLGGNLQYGTLDNDIFSPGATGKYTGYYYSTSDNVTRVATDEAERIIRETLTGATGPMETISTPWNPAVQKANKYAERIGSLGVNILQAHQINEMSRMAGSIVPGAAVDLTKESLLDNIGATYRMFGKQASLADMVDIARGRLPSNSGFSVGLNNYGLAPTASGDEIFGVAQQFAGISQAMGNTYSNLDIRSRVFSTVMAESTAETAKSGRGVLTQRLISAQEAGDDALVAKLTSQIESLAYADVADILPEYGVSHFKGQQEIRLLEGIGGDIRSTNRIFVPVTMLNEVADDVLASKGGMKAGRVSLSAAKNADGTEKINLFWKMGSDVSQAEKRSMMESLVDNIMLKHDALSGSERLMEENKRLVTTAAAIDSAGKGSVVDMLLEAEAKGGIGFAYDDTEMATRTLRNLARQGYDATNDELVSMMQADFIDQMGEGDIVRVGAFADDYTLTAAGATRSSGEEAVSALNRTASFIMENGIESEARTRVSRSRLGLGANKILDFYIGNKTNIRNAGLGLIAAGIGYYGYRRYKENQMYDETLEQQPIEYGGQRRSSPRLTQSDMASFRRDPLVTAGVVGNLDRNKIGHTQMGPNKYNHLYGA
jgi:hypothetical protein